MLSPAIAFKAEFTTVLTSVMTRARSAPLLSEDYQEQDKLNIMRAHLSPETTEHAAGHTATRITHC